MGYLWKYYSLFIFCNYHINSTLVFFACFLLLFFYFFNKKGLCLQNYILIFAVDECGIIYENKKTTSKKSLTH